MEEIEFGIKEGDCDCNRRDRIELREEGRWGPGIWREQIIRCGNCGEVIEKWSGYENKALTIAQDEDISIEEARKLVNKEHKKGDINE